MSQHPLVIPPPCFRQRLARLLAHHFAIASVPPKLFCMLYAASASFRRCRHLNRRLIACAQRDGFGVATRPLASTSSLCWPGPELRGADRLSVAVH